MDFLKVAVDNILMSLPTSTDQKFRVIFKLLFPRVASWFNLKLEL